MEAMRIQATVQTRSHITRHSQHKVKSIAPIVKNGIVTSMNIALKSEMMRRTRRRKKKKIITWKCKLQTMTVALTSKASLKTW